MAYLALVRHAKSKWNALGLWTGWTDVPLSPDGKRDAREIAKVLRNIIFHRAYSSKMMRAKHTLEILKGELGISNIQTVSHKALNERHYGIYTGKNKWQVQGRIGEENFKKLRRSWNFPIPKGETLKDVHDRVVPFYKNRILADLRSGHSVILVSHGNTLRALAKHLEKLTTKEIADFEIGVGETLLYEVNNQGRVVSKKIKARNMSSRQC